MREALTEQFRCSTETQRLMATIRKKGWPTSAKIFCTKRDAEDWARRAEDEMVRGEYIDRSRSERMSFSDAIDRYVSEMLPTKRLSTQ